MSNEKCQRCQSKRIADVHAKCSDACSWRGDGLDQENNYVPSGVGIGGGDYVEVVYCLDCGQIQGEWPIAENAVTNLRADELDNRISYLTRQITNYVHLNDQDRNDMRQEIKTLEAERDALLT